VLPVFRYATIQQIKDRINPELLVDPGPPPETIISDSQILERIQAASMMINKWTKQYFQPVPQIYRVSARGDRLLTGPQMLPFIVLKQIGMIDDRTTGQFEGANRVIPDSIAPERVYQWRTGGRCACTIPLYYDRGSIRWGEVAWELGSRTIEMIVRQHGFTRGYRNVEMTGWWAWLENYKVVETELTQAIPGGSGNVTQIRIKDAVDANSGDFIEVGDTLVLDVKPVSGSLIPTHIEPVIVQEIAEGTGEYQVNIDPLRTYPFEIPVGAPVYCYGRTPSALADVTQFLAVKLIEGLSAEITGDPVTSASSQGMLISERTDNYNYTLADVSGSSKSNFGSLGKYTGSPRMDLVLREFAQPTVAVSLI